MLRIDLTSVELQQAAQGARIEAVQAEKDAAQQSSPSARENFEESAKQYRMLTE
jgi:hypothetical protein